MRRLKRLPFLNGCPGNMTAEDKTFILDIVSAAADAMRRYSAEAHPTVGAGRIAINITAGMLEYEAKVWASRVPPSDYEDGPDEPEPDVARAFRSRQTGRA